MDKFDKYGAIWMLCTRWHSGQWSRGYRLLSRLSRIGYMPGHTLQNNEFESVEQKAYYSKIYSLRSTL